MRIQDKINRKEWDVILDTINELPDQSPPIDFEKLWRSTLAKYHLPSLFKKKD